MTPEQERILHSVHGMVERMDEKLDHVQARVNEHVATDSGAHVLVEARLDALEEVRDKLTGGQWVIMIVGPAVASVIAWLVGVAYAQ